MFNLKFLKVIRDYEFSIVKKLIPKGLKVLEVGGGTGYQAKCFAENGYEIESIEIKDGNYSNEKHFHLITEYDGKKIPFPDNSFDIVYSSNVLEHVINLSTLCDEMKRVLKPNGEFIHIIPSSSWRFWSSVTHYLTFITRILPHIPRLIPSKLNKENLRGVVDVFGLLMKLCDEYIFEHRHGEYGNTLTELITFNKFFWIILFRFLNFKIIKVMPTRFFYTGQMYLGKKLTVKDRVNISKWLGSACNIYILKNKK